MLHTELLRLINSKECWALIGSGPSIEAGCPGWERLLEETAATLTPDEAAELHSDPQYQPAVAEGNLPTAFLSVENIIGRSALESCIRKSIDSVKEPGPMHALMADLPFAGYITTNYDALLERALNAITPGWANAMWFGMIRFM